MCDGLGCSQLHLLDLQRRQSASVHLRPGVITNELLSMVPMAARRCCHPPLTLGRHLKPLVSVKSSTHPTSRPASSSACERLKSRAAFLPRENSHLRSLLAHQFHSSPRAHPGPSTQIQPPEGLRHRLMGVHLCGVLGSLRSQPRCHLHFQAQ